MDWTQYLIDIVKNSWGVLAEMAPYILFGFLMAGLIYVVLSPEWVKRHLGGKGVVPVLKAAVFGVPLPLCSCGVIPVGASIRRSGAGKGATTSFLLSTPQTGVDSILATYALLGPIFAVWRPVFAFLTGLVGGFVVDKIDPDEGENTIEDAVSDDRPPAGKRLKAGVRHGFITIPRDIGKALLVGLAIAGVVGALVPPDYLGAYLGGGILTMLAMMAFGIPFYVCSTASIPIAFALIQAGVSPGGALVFLVTGPATNAATIATIWRVLGRKSTVVYLGTMAVFALLSGFLFDEMLASIGREIQAHAHGGEGIAWWVKNGSAAALLVLLAFSFLPEKYFAENREEEMDEKRPGMLVHVEGMTCEHCAASVKKALEKVSGVESATVDLQAKSARLVGCGDPESIKSSVEEAGYEVTQVHDVGGGCNCGHCSH